MTAAPPKPRFKQCVRFVRSPLRGDDPALVAFYDEYSATSSAR